jgi:hypothetical protein
MWEARARQAEDWVAPHLLTTAALASPSASTAAFISSAFLHLVAAVPNHAWVCFPAASFLSVSRRSRRSRLCFSTASWARRSASAAWAQGAGGQVNEMGWGIDRIGEGAREGHLLARFLGFLFSGELFLLRLAHEEGIRYNGKSQVKEGGT